MAAEGSPSLTLGADSVAGADPLDALDSGAGWVSGAAFVSGDELASLDRLPSLEALGRLDSADELDSLGAAELSAWACGTDAGGLSWLAVVLVWVVCCLATFAPPCLAVARVDAVRPGNAWAAASAKTAVSATLPATSMRLIRASLRLASSRTPAWFAGFMQRVWCVPLRIR